MSRDLVTVLAEKVEALERKVAALEMGTLADPDIKYAPTCPKCGLTFVQAYNNCLDADCPTGMGPTISAGDAS